MVEPGMAANATDNFTYVLLQLRRKERLEVVKDASGSHPGIATLSCPTTSSLLAM